ncbi:radical SAM protein [Propionivibrio limicola]|uniref:radical SAM protein n=1 Tax=Propionivibrio limicola TaxID=167645 RepID=UPI001291C6D2|nr:radical SAM protein [Propionivibrio limicola]
MLNTQNHSRDSAGLKYIYPVVSRRAGGLSIGINLNVNNACNWACIYCQVPNLTRGGPPPVDLDLLENELRQFVSQVINGDYLSINTPPEYRRLVDIAFSGNGEPTSACEFPEAVERVERVIHEFGLQKQLPIRLITNGSLVHRPAVQAGISRIGAMGGEVWFKLDRATPAGIETVNGIRVSVEKTKKSLEQCCALAPTWIQTCLFAIDGNAPNEHEIAAYLDLLSTFAGKIQGVHLYGLARPSMQPQKERLSALPADSLECLARQINQLGIKTTVSL